MRRPTGRIFQARMLAGLRRARRRLELVDAMDPDDREAWRDDRVRRLRQYAIAHSAWYREHHRGLERAPLAELPVLTKADVVDRFAEVVTDDRLDRDVLQRAVANERLPRGLRIAASSGSSGRPGLFPFTNAEWLGLLVNAARARAIAGWPAVEPSTRRVRTARIGSPSAWHLSRQLPATLHDPRRPALNLSAATDTQELVEELSRWRPDVLSGYPSVLGALATAQLDGGLDIEPVQVFAAGESLSVGTRTLIEAAWGVHPFDQYATAEVGFVAVECEAHAGLHVMDTHVVVEIVDDDGRQVESDCEGRRVLVTALGSRTVPLIRYELGDVASFTEEPCPCGRPSPRIRSIIGTGRDLVRLHRTDGADVTVHPVAFTSVLDTAPVGGWQVRISPDRVLVLVVAPSPSFEPSDVRRSLRRSLERAGVDSRLDIEVEVVAHLPRSSTGKAGLVVVDTGG